MRSIKLLAGGLTLFAVVSLTAGCTGGAGPTKPKGTEAVKEDEHPHEGPHKGPIAEWGEEEYHVEFTVDHKTQEARVYILDEDVKKPKPIKADKVLLSIKSPVFQVELKPEPQKDDPPGTASCFAGKHENFGKEQEFAGAVSAEVNGKPYAGDFKEEAEHPHPKK